jgi:hypothetical protein
MTTENITHGLWAATLPSRPHLNSLKGNKSTDIAIVGGGYTGLSSALHLAETGRECVLLEAAEIGHGGAGRNVGLVNAGLWLMPEELVRIAGPVYGEKLLDVLGDSPDLVFDLIEKHGIECEALRSGTLHCADSGKGYKALEQREEQWLKRGAPVKLLGRDEAAVKTGSHSFHGALLDKRAGTIQPLAYACGLAEAGLKAGAQLYEHSPVTGIDETKLNVIARGMTVKQVLHWVEGKNGDAAIVWHADAVQSGKVRIIDIPDKVNCIDIIPVCSMKKSQHLKISQTFIDYLLSQGKKVFQKYGFKPYAN